MKTKPGLHVVFNNFPSEQREIKRKMSQHVRRTVFNVEGDVKTIIESNGQVDLGNMLNAVQGQMDDDQHGKVVAHADYSIYQNNGTRFMAGRPFMEPAAERNRKKFVDEAKAILKK